MSEKPTPAEFFEQMNKMIPEDEREEFYAHLMKEECEEEILSCMQEGLYELQFRETYCGLNLIERRVIQCPYLDSHDFIDMEMSNGYSHRVHRCRRETTILEDFLEENEN